MGREKEEEVHSFFLHFLCVCGFSITFITFRRGRGGGEERGKERVSFGASILSSYRGGKEEGREGLLGKDKHLLKSRQDGREDRSRRKNGEVEGVGSRQKKGIQPINHYEKRKEEGEEGVGRREGRRKEVKKKEEDDGRNGKDDLLLFCSISRRDLLISINQTMILITLVMKEMELWIEGGLGLRRAALLVCA